MRRGGVGVGVEFPGSAVEAMQSFLEVRLRTSSGEARRYIGRWLSSVSIGAVMNVTTMNQLDIGNEWISKVNG